MEEIGGRSDPLEQFRRAVVTVTRNTQRMMDILDTCERRFTSLDNNMAPIQKVGPHALSVATFAFSRARIGVRCAGDLTCA